MKGLVILVLFLLFVGYICKKVVEQFRGHRRHRRHRGHGRRFRPHNRWNSWGINDYYIPWFWRGSCKDGCVALGNGRWGCQYPGYGVNDCMFANDCDWCGGRFWW